jgi:hypothetical protein
VFFSYWPPSALPKTCLMAIERSRAATAAPAQAAVRASWLAWALIALAPFLILAPWFTATFDRDEGVYAAVALAMRDGLVPYSDVFDHKPPMIFAVYWGSFLLHDGVWLPCVLAAGACAVTAILLVHSARSLGVRWMTSWLAGGIFVLSLTNVYLQPNANTEVFVLPLTTASLLLVVRHAEHPSLSALAVAGVLGGIAMLFKSSAAFPLLALAAWLAFGRGVKATTALGIGISLSLGVCALLFLVAGAWADFWYANVTYNQLYSDAVPLADRAIGLFSMKQQVGMGGAPFWIFAFGGACVAVIQRRSGDMLLLAWAALSWLSVKFTGLDFNHYYVQVLPATALLAARLADGIDWQYRETWAKTAAISVITLFVAWQALVYGSAVLDAERRGLAHHAAPYWQFCAEGAPTIGRWVNKNSVAGDRVYNLGRDSAIHYYAARTPTYRFMYDRPFYLDPATISGALAQLNANPPRFIVDTSDKCGEGAPPPAAIVNFVRSNYIPVATVEYATIYERVSAP